MKKLFVMVILYSLLLCACGNSVEESVENDQNSDIIENITEENSSEDELSQSEWMEQHAGEMEDGYEVVDAINIDSGDTKLEYVSDERYTLESGEEILLVNFKFSNVSAGTTNLDSQYNFQAFQNGIEITVYSWLGDATEGDINRGKDILDGASIDVSVGIAPEDWESPIKLRVDDVMAYDDIENIGHTYQQQEIPLM